MKLNQNKKNWIKQEYLFQINWVNFKSKLYNHTKKVDFKFVYGFWIWNFCLKTSLIHENSKKIEFWDSNLKPKTHTHKFKLIPIFFEFSCMPKSSVKNFSYLILHDNFLNSIRIIFTKISMGTPIRNFLLFRKFKTKLYLIT